jgi:regulator of protease activity HflC (stomatin/prohibitin superfamily)
MTTASVQVQRQRFEGISGFSKETQEVIITATLNYSVAPGAVQNLYRTVGANWFNVLIEARINNFFKEETVKYDATAVAPSRELIRTAVKNRLAQDMDQYSVTISDLLIDNLDFRPEFKQAIENKQIATQDALREGERVKQKQNEAQQAIETAKGAAESTRINAEGQAAANRLLSASLTPEVIQFQAVQKLSDKITIALVPSGQGVILDPTTLLSGGINAKK